MKLLRTPIVSSLSLILAVALITAWVRSRGHADILGFYTPAGNLQALANDRQGMLVFLSDVPFGREMGLSADSLSSSSDEFREIHEWLFDPANEKWHFLGFRLAKGTVGTWTWNFNAVIVPYWALLIPLIILPTRMFRRGFVRIRRSRRGQCLVCGYDLRHSPERCPECGEPVRIKGKTTIAKSNEPAAKSLRMPVTRFLALSFATALIGSVLALFWRGHQENASGVWQAEESAGLHRRMVEFVARGTIEDAVETLRTQTGANIQVSWPKHQLLGFDRKAPVDVHLYDVDVATALRSLVLQANGDDAFGVWFAGSGQKIIVEEPRLLPRFVRVYSLGDIPTQLDMTSRDENVVGAASPSTTAQKYEGFDAAVTDAVRTDAWVANGGSGGDIHVWADRLAVLQTLDGHSDVQRMLRVLRQTGESFDLPPEPATVHDNLEQPIAELNLEDATLESAMEALRQQVMANIVVNWTVPLSDAGIHRHTQVRFHAWNLTLGRALSLISHSIDPEERPTYSVENGVITVAAHVVDSRVRMYDVRDIVADAMNFESARALPDRLPASVGNGLFRGGSTPGSYEDAMDHVTWFLEDAVAKESWKDNGGSAASIHGWSGRLFIHQTTANHLKIDAALRVLRGGGKEGAVASGTGQVIAETPGAPSAPSRSCDATSDSTTQPIIDHAFLGRPIAEVKFDSTLEQAFESLREMTQANLVVYWEDFAAAGIKRDTPIKVHLWDRTLGHTIQSLIALAGGDGAISCSVRDDVIEVGSISRLEAPKGSSTRLYDVRDVIDGAIAYYKLHAVAKGPPLPMQDPAQQGTTVDETVETLTKIIEDHIATDTWKDNGGQVGSIREFAGRLLITQTPDGHRRIVELLRAIRAGGGKEGIELGKLATTQPAQ